MFQKPPTVVLGKGLVFAVSFAQTGGTDFRRDRRGGSNDFRRRSSWEGAGTGCLNLKASACGIPVPDVIL